MKRFYSFCSTHNVMDPFPLSEQLLCYFASYLATQDLAPQTIKSYLSALRNMQISIGLPDPRDQSSLPMLKRVQAAISRARVLRGTTTKRIRLPITAQVLAKIRQALSNSSNLERLVLWAIACTAFFGFFRLGELLPESANAFNASTDLAWGDVAVDSHLAPTMIQIHLKKSKCDQFGAGSDVLVGSTGEELCRVRAILNYIVH